MDVPARQVRARYSAGTVTVYQAYRPEIALPALAAGRFVPPFSRERMTWIKPSFCWMMYRCGWATKPGQEHVLAVELTRAGFEEALSQACLSHYERGRHADAAAWKRELRTSPVRVQWDPERSMRMQQLPYRSLQVGLSGEAAGRYVDEWAVSLTDVTPLVREIKALLDRGADDKTAELLPEERPYPLPPEITAALT